MRKAEEKNLARGPWPVDEPPFWSSAQEFSSFLWSGFTPRSLVPVAALIVVVVAVAIGWWELVDLNQPFDALLAGLWLGMALLVSWRFEWRRDVVLALVAAIGGFVIEWWGTSTELWTYFTGETPPLWIIPAWPVAALSTERLAYAFERAFPPSKARIWRAAYVLLLPAFIAWMGWYMRPAADHLSSQVVVGIMLGVLVSSSTARHDVSLFIMGTALGWALEYWGTTRQCWTYYTGETPPLVTACAHGFASVAFWRAAHVIHGAWEIAKHAVLTRRGLAT